jgi:U4/U6.U5 tri-snRNP-associated protein 1
MAAEAEKVQNRTTGGTEDQAQREYENKQRAYNMAQRQMEAFKHYKPNVEIAYTDEFGRDLTPKEAWKHLSHKFHSKGSGTNKRQKLLDKIENERKKEAMYAGDTPLGTNAAFQARQERTGSATMILGVGNRK